MNGQMNGHNGHSDYSHSPINRATEGWLELFLTPSEKHTFSQWEEKIKDKSIVHFTTRPIFAWMATFFPDTIAPNVITLSGLLALSQAWYVTYNYGTYDNYPTACTWIAVINLIFFFITNSVEPYHTDRVKQRTPLNELFRYSCDSASTIFMVLLITYCLWGDPDDNTDDNNTDGNGGYADNLSMIHFQWLAVQSSQLILLLKHLSAYNRNAGLRYSYTGPGEVIIAGCLLLSLRAVIGIENWRSLYEFMSYGLLKVCSKFCPPIPFLIDNSALVTGQAFGNDQTTVGEVLMYVTYYILFLVAIIKTLILKQPHGFSRFGIITSLLMRSVPVILLYFGVPQYNLSVMDVICDGFFMAVLTSDITLAKMAGREIHPWVVLMSFAAVLSHTVILCLCLVYYIAVFCDLSFYMNLPLLSTCRNVYCDGIYDLCHIGHKIAFQNALDYGNRLYVGVIGDEDAMNYKRPPIMSHQERWDEVEGCKAVTKVIPNAPCFGIKQEFLDQHQIHVVAMGEEYIERYPDPKDDPYYGYVRQLGIARTLPRTERLSTSDLIRRIQSAQPADKKISPT